MDSLVNDKQTYEPLKRDPTPALQRRLNGKLLDLKKTETIDIQLYYRLRCCVLQSTKLYGLPKLHKPNIPMRPIVSFCGSLPCETEVPCSFFSVRDERNLCSQPHDFLSCMRELRQHLSRETPLPVFESKRHFLLFRGNSLRQLRSKKTSLCRQLLFLRRMCRLKLPQKPID